MGEFGDHSKNNADILVYQHVFNDAKKGLIVNVDGINASGFQIGSELSIGYGNEELKVTVLDVDKRMGRIQVKKT